MTNTIFSGLLTISMKVLDFFLQPISQLIHNSSLHDGFNAFTTNFANLMNTLKGVLPWVIEATGLPKPLFVTIFGVILAGITLRLSIFILKIILTWWDRIIA